MPAEIIARLFVEKGQSVSGGSLLEVKKTVSEINH
jgi:hypothetical protein